MKKNIYSYLFKLMRKGEVIFQCNLCYQRCASPTINELERDLADFVQDYTMIYNYENKTNYSFTGALEEITKEDVEDDYAYSTYRI